MFKFLTGLNSELDQVTGQVLSRQLIRSLQDVHAFVKWEESRRNVLLLDSGIGNTTAIAPNNSALVASNAASIFEAPKSEGKKTI